MVVFSIMFWVFYWWPEVEVYIGSMTGYGLKVDTATLLF